MLKLINLYKQLKSPLSNKQDNHVRFSACPILGYTKHRLAKDTDSFPCLLISIQESPLLNRPASIKLEHLEVLYDIDCRISHNDLFENSRFTVIRCTEHDPFLQDYFLRICATVITVIGEAPTGTQVSKIVNNLVELFRVMNEAPRKSVQGLWAELLLISLASDPITLTRAWHRSPEDKYDFSSLNQRIETKSSTSKIRKHHFSLEQLNPPQGVNVLIVSVIVERVGAGTTLAELAETVRIKINKYPELLLYLEQMISVTLGNNWRSITKDRFNYELAKKSLLFYSSEAIPCIDSNLPKGISDVHFKVDLTDIPVVDNNLLKFDGDIFQAISSI